MLPCLDLANQHLTITKDHAQQCGLLYHTEQLIQLHPALTTSTNGTDSASAEPQRSRVPAQKPPAKRDPEACSHLTRWTPPKCFHKKNAQQVTAALAEQHIKARRGTFSIESKNNCVQKLLGSGFTKDEPAIFCHLPLPFHLHGYLQVNKPVKKITLKRVNTSPYTTTIL